MKKYGSADKEGMGKRMGQSQFANLPQEVIMKPYRKVEEAGYGKYVDDVEGLDDSQSKYVSRVKKSMRDNDR